MRSIVSKPIGFWLAKILCYSDPDYYSLDYQYDELGNRRRVVGQFDRRLTSGTAMQDVANQDNWYQYDIMNRLSVTQGILLNGEITTGGKSNHSTAPAMH